jgi:WD40 repeat protein
MRRWFLSYNSEDHSLGEGLASALRRKDPDVQVYFASTSLRAGGFWLPELAKEIADATAFILLIGEKGIGPWQAVEYYEALHRHLTQRDLPIVPVLLDGQPAPGLPFLRQLHWVITAEPASEKSLAQLLDAAVGGGAPPGELWRHTAPYRGLHAMTESDADFFFGRTRETAEAIGALASAPDKLPILLGNSGVGKSSLAQAGVIAALMRQGWAETAEAPNNWPRAFEASRRWCFLKFKPGTEPIRALVEPFLWTWQFEAVNPKRAALQAGWADMLLDGKVTLRDLLDATQARYRNELHQPEPPAFLIYVDQGEELYVRASERERRRFSEILAHGLADPRLYTMMSLRADFFGDLQKDEPLYATHHQINVPPLREAQLLNVVSRPAELLGASFEPQELPVDIAQRTAEESVKDAGALPLLSYLLDDMWASMVKRGDGKLRLPRGAVEIGAVLVERVDAFLAAHSASENELRRIFTLKLATVQGEGEPTRRRALRSEFTDDNWRLVSELADHPNRLLVTATPEGGETYAEVAHEAIFRRWEKLKEWIAAEREFLAWRSGLEADRKRWEAAPESSRNDALLMGLPLAQARDWCAKRGEDLPRADRHFIELSDQHDALKRSQREREQKQKRRFAQAMVVMLIALLAVAVSLWLQAERQKNQALLAQSRSLPILANHYLDAGDVGTAMLILLDALPDTGAGIKRPYTPEAEAALFRMSQKLQEIALLNHHAPIRRVAFSPDGHSIVTASGDGVWIWNSDTHQLIGKLTGYIGTVTGVGFSGDGSLIVISSTDKTAHIWDANTRRQISVLDEGVGIAEFSRDGQRVVTVDGKSARIWDVKTGRQLATLTGHEGPVRSVGFSPDGRLIVTSSNDRTARIWASETYQQIAVLQGDDFPSNASVNSAAFNPDGSRIVTTQWKTVRIWDVATRAKIATLRYDEFVNTAAFSPDGRRIAVGGDESVRVYDAEDNREVAVLLGHRTKDNPGPNHRYAGAGVVSFSPDDRFVATASWDETVRIWNLEPERRVPTLVGHDDLITSVAFSSDGRRVLTGSRDKTARIWDAETHQQIAILAGHDSTVTSAAFSPIGRFVATTSDDKTARLWDADTGQQVAVLSGHGETPRSAAFSPDSRLLVIASDDNTVRVWDAATHQQIGILQGHKGPVNSVGFSSHGTKIITASDDRTARIWDSETYEQIGILTLHEAAVNSASFLNEHFMVTGSADSLTFRWVIYNNNTDVIGAGIRGEGGSVLAVAFSPDGKRLLVVSDRTTEILDVRAKREVAMLARNNGGPSSAAFSPDGRLVVVAASAKTAQILRVFPSIQDLIAYSRQVLPRCLTREQRDWFSLDSDPPKWCIEMKKWPYD